jgi:hypothetical protein
MRRFAAIALCLLFTGCLSETTAPSAALLVGTWSLVSVNSSPVPFTYPNGKQVMDETVVILQDGTYSATAHYSDATTYNETGVLTIVGATVLFTDITGNIQYDASWNETAMTQHIGNYSLGFRKL